MNIEIKNRWTDNIIICGKYESIKECLERNRGADLYGANLRGADLRDANLRDANLYGANLYGADLCGANLYGANLRGADLYGADLCGANLYGANLCGADLRDANLYGANLRGANLRDANLRDAKGEPVWLPDLYLLKLQDKNTKLRAWKYLVGGKSPYQYAVYKEGKEYKTDKFDKDENNTCSIGLNVATLQWCMKNGSSADEFIEVEFQVKDIIAIPFGTDGKFRVKKLKVLKKYNRKEVNKLLKKVLREARK